ncbi:MAG: polysaccharide deacetylase family protein [Alicyclobacillus macrosporangiidus]|uniref:polysaccharide deacetylase family protein n=1 Tax=Alicyclobacillus macrosporangiidus TaxID=392015 RepID=UPI0026E95A33|nr:polysaccharide deacetylase family protein [Alicyclobacillus macrosporangiidus]MCL6598254.1 polysaccharide deacetylase family protein [Alicyclobacillus macrosporangiidus]
MLRRTVSRIAGLNPQVFTYTSKVSVAIPEFYMALRSLNWKSALLADEDGIQIGDRTADHPNLLHLGYDVQYREIAAARDTIEQATSKPLEFFRQPYGNYDNTTLRMLAYTGLKIVLWDVDTPH